MHYGRNGSCYAVPQLARPRRAECLVAQEYNGNEEMVVAVVEYAAATRAPDDEPNQETANGDRSVNRRTYLGMGVGAWAVAGGPCPQM